MRRKEPIPHTSVGISDAVRRAAVGLWGHACAKWANMFPPNPYERPYSEEPGEGLTYREQVRMTREYLALACPDCEEGRFPGIPIGTWMQHEVQCTHCNAKFMILYNLQHDNVVHAIRLTRHRSLETSRS